MVADDNHLSRIPKECIEFPLAHPEDVEASVDLDAELFGNWQKWKKFTLMRKIRYRLATMPVLQKVARRLRSADKV